MSVVSLSKNQLILNLYRVPVKVKDEFEVLKTLLFLYSSFRTLKGLTTKKLRPKLVQLLSLYIKHGYSRDTKGKAAKILSVTKASINSMNLELRRGGYLIKDDWNERINHLNPDLKGLAEYYVNNGTKPIRFLFDISIDEA